MEMEKVVWKKIAWIIAIATFLGSLLTGTVDYAVEQYKGDQDRIKLEAVCVEQKHIKGEITEIRSGNKYRDKQINEFNGFIKEDQSWKIKDAEWKGVMSEIMKQSLFYGKVEDVKSLQKLSDDIKKGVSKKKSE